MILRERGKCYGEKIKNTIMAQGKCYQALWKCCSDMSVCSQVLVCTDAAANALSCQRLLELEKCSQEPRSQGFSAESILSSDATGILNITTPSASPLWVEFLHIVMSMGTADQGRAPWAIQPFSFGEEGWCPHLIIMRDRDDCAWGVRGVSRNRICKPLALLSHGKAPFSSESKQCWI